MSIGNDIPITYRRGILMHAIYLAGAYTVGIVTRTLLIGLSLLRKRSVRSRALLFSGESVLLIRHTLDPMSWNLPGGGLKASETAAQAVVREVREELGVRIPSDEIFAMISVSGARHNLRADYEVFGCKIDLQSFRPTLGAEILEARWFAADNLPKSANTVCQISVRGLRDILLKDVNLV